MDVQEVRAKKAELEAHILEKLNEFQNETSCLIENLNFRDGPGRIGDVGVLNNIAKVVVSVTLL